MLACLAAHAEGLERDLAAHGVAEEDDGPVADGAADGVEIMGVLDELYRGGILGFSAAPVASIVPVGDAHHAGEVVPEVLPDEAVARDAVGEDGRERRPGHRGRRALVRSHVDARAVIQGNEVSMHNAVTAGWAKREGKWLNVSAVASARA